MPKYYNNPKTIDDTTIYKEYLKNRDLKKIKLFVDNYNVGININFFGYYKYTWTKSDNLIRLSNRFYSTKDYWWIIGAFNQKPVDSLYTIGEEIFIPAEPMRVLEYLNGVRRQY